MDDRDLLSGLPVGIIEDILTRIPLIDAISTSFLSTKWRNRWVTIPCLSFQIPNEMYCSESDEDESVNHQICLREDLSKTFVTHTLSRYQGPLHKFRLVYISDDAMELSPESADMDQWLLFLSTTHVKELTIRQSGDCFDLSDSLYSLQNLTHLDLYCGLISPPPSTFKGFLYLTTLVLMYVELPSCAIESIVANSPLLENLECERISILQEESIRLSAPNLKYIRMGYNVVNLYLCAPLLAKLSVTVYSDYGESFGAELHQPRQSVCYYTEFFRGCTNLQSLAGSVYFLQYLGIGIKNYHSSLVFHQLRLITLNRVNFRVRDQMLAVIHLLMDAVNLYELHICSSSSDSNYVDAAEVPQIHICDTEYPQNCTFEKLTVATMQKFTGCLHELKFIKFLLESSPLLKEMIIQPQDNFTDHQRLNATLELLSYRRASTSAMVLFEKRRISPLDYP